MKHFVIGLLFVVCISPLPGQNQSADLNTSSGGTQTGGRRPVVYVMPNALSNPGSGDTSQVIVDSARNGKEPQVAMIYRELQHRKECQGFSENMIKERADYFLLLQHGGGRGNRWAVSNKGGDVIASGQSIHLGNSVKDACLAMMKNWQKGENGGGSN